jgi:tetratricopeptide (TPR) repeat protein
MTNLRLLAAVLVLAASSAALAESPKATAKARKAVAFRVASGDRQLDRARAAGSTASRLDAYDDAIREFRTARRAALARKTDDFGPLRLSAERGLVRAFSAEAEIYWRRGSLKLARERVTSALDIDANDARSQNLALLIESGETADPFTIDEGAVAVERLRQRRADVGLPFRERAGTNRR